MGGVRALMALQNITQMMVVTTSVKAATAFCWMVPSATSTVSTRSCIICDEGKYLGWKMSTSRMSKGWLSSEGSPRREACSDITWRPWKKSPMKKRDAADSSGQKLAVWHYSPLPQLRFLCPWGLTWRQTWRLERRNWRSGLGRGRRHHHSHQHSEIIMFW